MAKQEEDFDTHRITLEKNIAAAKSLIADLQNQQRRTQDTFRRSEIQVNIDDVTKQLQDWEYELSGWTQGRE